MSETLVATPVPLARGAALHTSFTHLINPFRTDSPEHARAQEITFAAMRNAIREAQRHRIEVELLAAVLEGDERAIEPPARRLPPLRRALADVLPMERPRRLPLFADLMQLAYEHGRGDYVIFTNMDISPQVDFYYVIQRLLPKDPQRPRALVINRRTISAHYTGPEQLREMYQEQGVPHEGFDCFVFPRAWIPQLLLGDLPIGTAGFDQVLLANLEILTGCRTDVLYRQRLTFHLGDDKAWARESEVYQFSKRETARVMRELRPRCPRIPVRSRFVYVYHIATREPPPPASLLTRIYCRLKLELKERLYTWKIRRIRAGW